VRLNYILHVTSQPMQRPWVVLCDSEAIQIGTRIGTDKSASVYRWREVAIAIAALPKSVLTNALAVTEFGCVPDVR
jgi:hypothetical protein